jgi:integration host factor subunit beta
MTIPVEEKDWLTITKSDLIERLTNKQLHLPCKSVELAVKKMIEHMASALALGMRIEIRDFGSFTLRHRKRRKGRNPKTGEEVWLDSKYVPHFKPGKELRERVNESMT